mgnify:CR=1 FL=1
MNFLIWSMTSINKMKYKLLNIGDFCKLDFAKKINAPSFLKFFIFELYCMCKLQQSNN